MKATLKHAIQNHITIHLNDESKICSHADSLGINSKSLVDRDQRTSRKVYLKVRVEHLPDGRVWPLMFRAKEGEAARIDRILDVREAPSLKMGGQGTRYTCRVGGKEIYLYHDRDKWFMEE